MSGGGLLAEEGNSLPDFDVAIIGCGPAGALLANLLGQAGHAVVVLERSAEPTQLPRAIHFDGEVMRAFQSCGLSEAMSAISRPAADGTRFTTAEGDTLLFRPGFEEVGPQGWPANSYVHQPNLETVLRDGIARFDCVDLRTRQEVTQVTVDGDIGIVESTDLDTGKVSRCSARFVVGAEGARSLVRREMDSTMNDMDFHQPWLVVDVIVDPASPRAQAMPGYSIQLCDPKRPMSIIYVEGNRRRWEIMLMPGDDPDRMTDPDIFWPMLAPWLGPEDAELERSAVYTFHAMIATPWRKGPLLLAGDACHLTPPFLGQGLCAGSRDVMNLAWKLDMVLRGKTRESLLDTYETERSPHVAVFIELAVELGEIVSTTDVAKAAERDARMLGGGEPRTILIPAPPLGSGAWIEGHEANGSIFPQPRLADGRLMDEAIKGRLAVVAEPAILAGVDEETKALWADLDIAIVAADGDVAAALTQRDIGAVVLRPDGYVFGAAADAAELSAITASLPRMLDLSRRPAAADQD